MNNPSMFTTSTARISSPTPAMVTTDLRAAFRGVATVLDVDVTGVRNLAPTLVLVGDGEATDEWRQSLDDLLAVPWAGWPFD